MNLSAFAPLLLGATLFSISACDVDVFGVYEKKIAGGYELSKGEDGSFAVIDTRIGAGEGITQIGWRKPFIIAVKSDGDWELFDTSSDMSQLSLTADQIRADPRVRDIPLILPDAAWKQLHHYRSQW